MLPSRGGVGCSRISESGLLGTRNRPIQPTTRTAMNYVQSRHTVLVKPKTIVRVYLGAYLCLVSACFPTADTPTAIPMAIPYPVHIGRLRCIVTGCAGRSRYCEFLHTDTHASITRSLNTVRACSVTPVFAAYTLPPQLGDMARTHHCTCGSVTARAAVPLDTLFAQLGDAARARTHQCARALLLGLLVDLCYLYAIDHIKTNQANPEPCSPTLTCCSHSLTSDKIQKTKPPQTTKKHML